MYKDIKKLIEYPKEGILSKNILKGKKLNVSLFCMAAGADMSRHTSTKQGLVYVLDGDGIFNLKGKKIRMKRGIFINMEKNAVHSLKADKNTSFLLILIESNGK